MSWETDFDEMMISVIGVRRVTARDNYGAVTLGPVTNFHCHIANTPRRVLNMAGQEVIATGTAWFSGGVPPNLNGTDRLVLPDGTTTDIIRIDKRFDEDGEHHEVAYWG